MPKRLSKQELKDWFVSSIGMTPEDAADFSSDADSADESDLPMPPVTHAFGKHGYEICVRSGVFYYSYTYWDKNEQCQKDKEVPLFSVKQKTLHFPYRFNIENEEKEFTEDEYKDIVKKLHRGKT